jgi:hypothetical protein
MSVFRGVERLQRPDCIDLPLTTYANLHKPLVPLVLFRIPLGLSSRTREPLRGNVVPFGQIWTSSMRPFESHWTRGMHNLEEAQDGLEIVLGHCR